MAPCQVRYFALWNEKPRGQIGESRDEAVVIGFPYDTFGETEARARSIPCPDLLIELTKLTATREPIRHG